MLYILVISELLSVVSLPSACLMITIVIHATMSDIQSAVTTCIYTGFKEQSSKAHSFTYPTERLVETVGTAVTAWRV